MGDARAYYNELDPFAAAWLRELIANHHIAPGDVDERSIADVTPGDVAGYTQCHFFAGIGVWSYALRRAGWRDDRPVWTGSCPCQPFSAAGKGDGFADPRHLWPHLFRLIGERRPNVCFGEQVASPDGLRWLDLVSADLEGAGYAIGAADLCAAGVGAPHIRQRLYWVADTGQGIGSSGGFANAGRSQPSSERSLSPTDDQRRRAACGMANNDGLRQPRLRGGGQVGAAEYRETRNVGDTASGGRREFGDAPLARRGRHPDRSVVAGFWGDAEWIYCRDERWRPVEPGTFPLAHGAPARVGRLRGYGNALNAETAIAFIEAYRDVAEAVAEPETLGGVA